LSYYGTIRNRFNERIAAVAIMENDALLSSVTDVVLENGLKVICLKKTGAPIVSVQVWYKTGSVHEQNGIRGISHFFEHMMFKGSKNVGSEEHSRRINDVGGHCNAFTAEDVTAYLNSVPRAYLDMVLQLEADRMRNLSVTPEILDTERKVIIEEFQGYMNNPLTKAFLEFRKVFYGNHPYATGPLGDLEDIRSIRVEDCLQYYRTWYRPDNAVVVVVGDIDSTADTLDRINATLGAAVTPPDTGAEKGSVAIPNVSRPGAAWMERKVDFDVPFLILGYPAPSARDTDALPLEILQSIISQGETARMHRDIVRRRSLAVMVGGVNQCLKRSGMSLFFAVFTPDVRPGKVEKALVEQIDTVKRDGVTREEMEKVRNATLTNRIFEVYSAEQICQRLGFSETVEGDYKAWVRRLDALERLTSDTLIASARAYWDEARRHTLYLKPKKIKPLYYFAGLFRRFFLRKKGK
jgi:zinc protease